MTRSADTHLLKLDLPAFSNIDVYMKDESTHPSGSLKHRLARSLFMYAIVNGWIGASTTVVEASSGSTAVSEAYFAKLLNLRFIAVMPASTSPEKIAAITFHGGETHLVEDATQVVSESRRLASSLKGHFMDQFTYAERATDWRGNNNIAESIFAQMENERFPLPSWIVVGAGTGSTATTIGRYKRYRGIGESVKLCVVDPENSVFYDYFTSGDASLTLARGSQVEGIGRPRVEPSFVPSVVDSMMRVQDAASFAAMRVLHQVLGKRPGGSSGTCFYGTLRLVNDMAKRGQKGSIVSMSCDPGERYMHSYYNDAWLIENHINIRPYEEQLLRFVETGEWREVTAHRVA
jgi:cysteine synthase A